MELRSAPHHLGMGDYSPGMDSDRGTGDSTLRDTRMWDTRVACSGTTVGNHWYHRAAAFPRVERNHSIDLSGMGLGTQGVEVVVVVERTLRTQVGSD